MGNCIPNAGAYPGNRRVAMPAYQPGDAEYKRVDSSTAVASAHFVTCPGGNALTLLGKPNRADGHALAAVPGKYIQVTLPPGVREGEVIHVRAPHGRLNAIAVPQGMGPGSTFTVEFSEEALSPPKEEDLAPGTYVPTVVAEPEAEMAVPAGDYRAEGGVATVVAQPTTRPYVLAYAAKE